MTGVALRTMQVCIRTFTDGDRTFTFHVLRHDLPTFLIAETRIKFYSFVTTDGTQQSFLYSDIRHISFTEV
jgi:hypothetical protein